MKIKIPGPSFEQAFGPAIMYDGDGPTAELRAYVDGWIARSTTAAMAHDSEPEKPTSAKAVMHDVASEPIPVPGWIQEISKPKSFDREERKHVQN